MGIFSRFPYTDFHRLNADWILEKVKEAAASVAEALGLVRQSATDAAEAAATVQTYEGRLEAAEAASAGAVRYDITQELTIEEGNIARANIGAARGLELMYVRENYVRADGPQQPAFSDQKKAQARENIGAAAAGVIPSGVVRYDVEQQLSVIQAAQARLNIGAAAAGDAPSGVVRYDVGQALTDNQKSTARSNIGAAEAGVVPSGAVRYDAAQELTSTQQAAARSNIGAAEAGVVPSGAVRYDAAQSLTDAQQLRARDNIGAPAYSDPAFNGEITLTDDAAASSQGDELTISLVSTVGQSAVALAGSQSSYVILSGLAAPVNDRDAANKAYVWNSLLKEITVSGTTPVIDLASEIDGTCYETLITCTGTAPTSITISTAVNSPLLATIVFTTGATVPTFNPPPAIRGLTDLTLEANTTYEISIRSNRATWKAWEVSA